MDRFYGLVLSAPGLPEGDLCEFYGATPELHRACTEAALLEGKSLNAWGQEILERALKASSTTRMTSCGNGSPPLTGRITRRSTTAR